MKKLGNTLIVCISIVSMGLMACSKTGPAGPAGATGATGPAGPTGPTGPTGPAGTANVIYSNWTANSTWAIDAPSGLNYFDITTASLTQTMMNTGTLLVYWAVLGDITNNVRQVPFFETIGSNIYFHNPKYIVGKVRIETNNLAMATTNRYRYIFIPGGVVGRGVNPEVDYNNYEAVLRYFGIPR